MSRFGKSKNAQRSNGQIKNEVAALYVIPLVNSRLLIFICAVVAVSAFSSRFSYADDIDDGFQRIVENIKSSCRANSPASDAEYVDCSQKNYDAMHSFFEKFYNARDTKGPNSREFQLGLDCWDIAASGVSQIERRTSMEHANWIRVNDCYTAALQK